jgi:hypothetical protein
MVWRARRLTSTSSWPAQSPDLNIIEPLWSILETRMRNRFPPPSSLKQVEDIQEKWYKFSYGLFKTCTSPFQEGLRQYWRQWLVQHHINKEICTVSVMFPLFCPTLVSPRSKTNTVYYWMELQDDLHLMVTLWSPYILYISWKKYKNCKPWCVNCTNYRIYLYVEVKVGFLFKWHM